MRPISYLNDAGESREWAQLVRLVGMVGVVAAAASFGQLLITLLSAMGPRTLWTVNIRPLTPTGLTTAVPAALLLAGGIGCVSLRPFGRPLMIAYAVAALLVSLLNAGFLVVRVVSGGFGAAPGRLDALGYVLYFGLGIIPTAAMPVVVIVLMTRARVKGIFRLGG